MALPHAASMQQGDVIWSFSHTLTHGSAVGCARSFSRLLTLPPCPGQWTPVVREGEERGGGEEKENQGGGGCVECTARLTPYTDRYNKDEYINTSSNRTEIGVHDTTWR